MSKAEMSDINETIRGLRDEINHHNELYYQKSEPEISDREFDELLKRLQDLEEKKPRSGYTRFPHTENRRKSRWL